jgi:hypothetical protein
MDNQKRIEKVHAMNGLMDKVYQAEDKKIR